MDKARRWLAWEKEDLDQKIRHYSKFRLLLFAASIFAFGFSIFWFWQQANFSPVKQADEIASVLVLKWQSPILDKVFNSLSFLASESLIIALIFFLGFYLFLKRRRRAAVVTWTVLAASGIINVFLRNFIFGRLRPGGCIPSLFGIESCFSFPSGHALWSVYFYGLLLYLVFRFVRLSIRAFLWIFLALAVLVTLIGLSRIYLGVHYFSDIVGGFFHGGAWLLLAILSIDILYHEVK